MTLEIGVFRVKTLDQLREFVHWQFDGISMDIHTKVLYNYEPNNRQFQFGRSCREARCFDDDKKTF
jgi:hypothetical protein